MMKKSTVLIFIFLHTFFLMGQKIIDGVYLLDDGSGCSIITISDSVFHYIAMNSFEWSPAEGDTLAVCKIKKTGKEFIKLNSDSLSDIANKKMKITKYHDASLMNKKKLTFNLPFQERVNIYILTDPFKRYVFCQQDSNSITLPEKYLNL